MELAGSLASRVPFRHREARCALRGAPQDVRVAPRARCSSGWALEARLVPALVIMNCNIVFHNQANNNSRK